VHLDFLGVPGAAVPNQSLQLFRKHGFPAGKRLIAGVIDGRSVWADNGACVPAQCLHITPLCSQYPDFG
jgi:hypothetical protein